MSEDKQWAIEALEKAGFRHDARGHSWVRESGYPGMPDIAGPSADKVCLTMVVSVEQLPALLAPGYTAEQAEAADKLADVVGSVTFLGNGPNGATIAVGDLTRLAMALDEYRNAKRDGGSHA